VIPVEVGKEKKGFIPHADGGTVVFSEGIDEDGSVRDLVDGNVLIHPGC
jgi:hypothetical protein